MHRNLLLKHLAEYQASSAEDKGIIQRFTQFVESTPDCFERSHESGHITGSAFVLSPDRSCVLLTMHAKLKKWLQLGGHADGCPYIHEVALREATEESGISALFSEFDPPIPIDFDIHKIPSNTKEKAHFHYDVRFVFHSQEKDFTCSNESIALKWIPIKEISRYCSEGPMLRVIKKIEINRTKY